MATFGSLVGLMMLNVSGHRLGTAEVEGALVSLKSVAEATGSRPDEIKGQG